MFFRDDGPVPDTLRSLTKRLNDAGIPHVLMGSMALGVLGYRRMTNDVDVCMREQDLDRFRQLFVGKTYQPVEGWERRFVDPTTQTTIDILVAGHIAGNTRKQKAVRFPDPDEAEIVDGVPVPSLAKMIELKLVTWRYKDWGDVIELIRLRRLDESFAEKLHPIIRIAYLQCYDNMIDSERYEPGRRDPQRGPDDSGGPDAR